MTLYRLEYAEVDNGIFYLVDSSQAFMQDFHKSWIILDEDLSLTLARKAREEFVNRYWGHRLDSPSIQFLWQIFKASQTPPGT